MFRSVQAMFRGVLGTISQRSSPDRPTGSERNRFRLESLGIFLFALLLFTLGIWDQQPQGFDGRWRWSCKEMFRHGASLFPTTYGQPYADYPGTATFFSFVFARLFGAPNHLANVLPTRTGVCWVIALLIACWSLRVGSGRCSPFC